MREATGRIAGKAGAKRYGFGWYEAANYDELIDHPVEMGTFELVSFEACGAQHDAVFTGRVPNLDLERIARDNLDQHVRIMEILCAYIRENAPAHDAQKSPVKDWPDWPD